MIQEFKDKILPAICATIPCSFWNSLTRVNPLIVYYHTVSDEKIPHVEHLYRFRTVADFRRDIDCFCRHFQPISLHQLLESVKTGWLLPRNAILLTFDDGLGEIFHVIAPILREKGVPATFFLTTAFLDNKGMAHHNKISILIERLTKTRSKSAEAEILKVLSSFAYKGNDIKTGLLQLDGRTPEAVGRIAQILDVDFDSYLEKYQPYLTSEQVRKLIEMGFTIGGHSLDHPLYGTLSLSDQLHQSVASVRFLRERFFLNYGAFAFPHGDRGVSEQFFDRLFSTDEIHVSFGTRGLIKESIPRHFQRFSMENTLASAERVIARSYARNLYKRLTGNTTVDRSLFELEKT